MRQREIDRLYKEKMISGGYCPKCGDFLIPRKRRSFIQGTTFVTGISLECINPQCDYKIDLGDNAQVTEHRTEINNPIGSVGTLYHKNEINHRNAFGSKDIVMCSGQIHRSFPKLVKRSSVIDMDKLDQEGKLIIVDYLDEENKIQRDFLEDIRFIDE